MTDTQDNYDDRNAVDLEREEYLAKIRETEGMAAYCAVVDAEMAQHIFIIKGGLLS